MRGSEGPKPGDVRHYPYLWARQAGRGKTEGRKMRPPAIAVLMRRADGRESVILPAITSQRPLSGRAVLEVPETERRRAGLAGDIRSWIVLDEHNVDLAEDSYYLEPAARIGALSARFLKELQRAFADTLRARGTRGVRRADEA